MVQQEFVGWGSAVENHLSISEELGKSLYSLGIRDVFGILGGGISYFADGLMKSPFRFFHFRHEAGAGFAAVEAYFETQRPSLAVVTTGPGLTNIMTAIYAARWDGAKLLLVSGASNRSQMSRGPVQETSASTMNDPVVFGEGSLFHFAAQPETFEELESALQRIQIGFESKSGFVAHLSLSGLLQKSQTPFGKSLELKKIHFTTGVPDDATLRFVQNACTRSKTVIWAGFGSRDAWMELRDLADRTRTPVILTPRAKGVFDEKAALFVGVSGAGGHESVKDFFEKYQPETILVLGTKLSEVSSFFQKWSLPKKNWIQVDLDTKAFASAFPLQREGHFLQFEIKSFLSCLNRQLAKSDLALDKPFWSSEKKENFLEVQHGKIRPQFLMQKIQEEFLDKNDLVVMSEAGSAFAWSNNLLKFSKANQYRTSAAWGSMGHFATGAVGAALAGSRKIVSILGDGAFLMNNEISTAVQYRANVIWCVLNDAQFGLNEHGMNALGMKPIETQIPRVDFVKFARAQGADGLCVKSESEIASALNLAWQSSGPFVLDFDIDPSIVTPILALRARNLAPQKN